jgi:hypothetical protein
VDPTGSPFPMGAGFEPFHPRLVTSAPRRLPRSGHYRAGMPVGGSAVNSAPASWRLYVSPGERHFEPVIVYITGNERGLR